METKELLEEAKLHYSTDTKPGISRKKSGDSFTYVTRDGQKITDEKELERIKKLGIPPAWERVWVCPSSKGHLQAVGYDSRGRKQYRYHPEWIKVSQESKYHKMIEFAKLLPRIRRQVNHDLNLPGMQREKVIATVVWLLENTLIRIGNKEYVEENKSYGLTTLKNRHVDVEGNTVKFEFKGKSGVYHKVKARSKRVANIIRHCQDLPGQQLFEYLDEEGKVQTIDSGDVNDYLKRITGEEVTAKDFRTWGGTITAAKLLDEVGLCESEKDRKKNVTQVVKEVASHLRNRPATCKKYYINPLIFDAYNKGLTLSKISVNPNDELYKEIEENDRGIICLINKISS
jgi:DNA topoisomerase-1